jgi:hypothetical protein
VLDNEQPLSSQLLQKKMRELTCANEAVTNTDVFEPAEPDYTLNTCVGTITGFKHCSLNPAVVLHYLNVRSRRNIH